MVTGDNVETAIAISKECQIVPAGLEVIIPNDDIENEDELNIATEQKYRNA